MVGVRWIGSRQRSLHHDNVRDTGIVSSFFRRCSKTRLRTCKASSHVGKQPRHGCNDIACRIRRGNRLPASFMVDTQFNSESSASIGALACGRSGLRDGSRTRDRQSFNLMLYPLSYFDGCSFRTHLTEHGSPNRSDARKHRAAGTPPVDRHDDDTVHPIKFAKNNPSLLASECLQKKKAVGAITLWEFEIG